MENSIQSYENMNHPFPMQTVENQRDQYQLISDEDFFKNMPVGFRFHPSDEELTGYLIQKVRNEPLPPNRIHEVRLYDCSPEFLAENYTPCGENEWYFFTPRDKKYKNGSRPRRNAGGGYWKATGADRVIVRNGEKISCRKSLLYYKGKPLGGVKTCWTMQEYNLNNPPAPVRTSENSMRLDNWVLCRLIKKPMTVKKSETKGKADEQRARPSSSRRKPEIDDIEDEQLEDEISQDTTMGTPMEASEEPMPCINQAQLSNNFPYNQALNVHPAPLAFWNPGDYMYSMGFQACNPIPINQQAGMSSDQYIYKVPQMYLEPGNSLQGNYFARSNCPYYPQSHDISDLISRRASISGSEDGSNVSVNHEIPAPILGSQESAQYSLSNEIPGPISRRQDEYSLSQNSAPVHHEFPGPTFQGQKEVPLPQIPGPGPGPNSSVEEEFPGIMSLDMNEGWDLDYLSTVWSESPGPWPHPDPKLKFV